MPTDFKKQIHELLMDLERLQYKRTFCLTAYQQGELFAEGSRLSLYQTLEITKESLEASAEDETFLYWNNLPKNTPGLKHCIWCKMAFRDAEHIALHQKLEEETMRLKIEMGNSMMKYPWPPDKKARQAIIDEYHQRNCPDDPCPYGQLCYYPSLKKFGGWDSPDVMQLYCLYQTKRDPKVEAEELSEILFI